MARQFDSRDWSRWLFVTTVAILVICGIGNAIAWSSSNKGLELGTQYQAIVLTTGQIFFGKIRTDRTNPNYVLLEDVYYVRTETSEKSNGVVLVKRGRNESHAPGSTPINSAHILLIEPVGANSLVAKKIAELQKALVLCCINGFTTIDLFHDGLN